MSSDDPLKFWLAGARAPPKPLERSKLTTLLGRLIAEQRIVIGERFPIIEPLLLKSEPVTGPVHVIGLPLTFQPSTEAIQHALQIQGFRTAGIEALVKVAENIKNPESGFGKCQVRGVTIIRNKLYALDATVGRYVACLESGAIVAGPNGWAHALTLDAKYIPPEWDLSACSFATVPI